MEQNKTIPQSSRTQQPLKFLTHRSPRTVKVLNRTRFEAPYPAEVPFLIHFDRIDNEKWITPMHYHNYFEITYVAEGSAWFLLHDQAHYASAGDMFITKSQEAHCGGATGKMVTYTIGFTFDQLHELELPFYQLGARRVFGDTDGSYRHGHESLLQEMEGDKLYTSTLIKALVMELLVGVLRNLQRSVSINEKEESTVMSDTVKEAIQLIHARGMSRLTSNEIATSVNRSRSQLDREFKNFMGVTLGDYIRQIRVDMAKYLLKKDAETITNISEQLEFESPQAFCMFFKRQTGLYPQEYRLSHQSPE